METKHCQYCAQAHDPADCPWLDDVKAYERESGSPCDNKLAASLDDQKRYWLCCGSFDPWHEVRCVDMLSGNLAVHRYGTAKEHSIWQLEEISRSGAKYRKA